MRSVVSILIPAYNAERWIAETLNSALLQTWPYKEIIVVDDGSTDRTLHIARQFESRLVKVLSQRNQGASTARNNALTHAQGDYIQWLDADDLLASDKIAKQMSVIESATKQTLLSSAWGSFMYRPSKARFVPTSLWADLSPVEWLLWKMSNNFHMQPATWLVSRELTRTAGPWDVRLSLDDDGEYFCRVVRVSDAIRFVADARVFYRDPGWRRLSAVDGSDEKFESQFLSIMLQIRQLRSLEDSPRVRAACVAYLQIWLFCFYDGRKDLANKLKEFAVSLGGDLEIPQLRKKYRWIRHVAGRRAARGAQELLPRSKWALMRLWDCMLCRLEELKLGKHGASLPVNIAS